MNKSSVLVVLLSCLTICAAAKCNLIGNWENDLGSKMNIDNISDQGQFLGYYLTAVSDTNATIEKSPLIGYQELNGSSIFGFTVQWTFANSITVFTGQCFINETGLPVLKTTWLLRSESKAIEDDWKQTRVGYNIFHSLPTKSMDLKPE